MKRTLVVALVIGLVAGSLALPADAKKKKKKKVVRTERTVSQRYDTPAIGASGAGGICTGCAAFPNAPEEVWMSIEVVDDVNPMAGSRFSWDTDGDGTNDTGFFVCGSTDEPIQVPGGITVTAFPYLLGQAGTDCPGGNATTGTINVTFSNLP